jgi:hypothetical protein
VELVRIRGDQLNDLAIEAHVIVEKSKQDATGEYQQGVSLMANKLKQCEALLNKLDAELEY